MAPNSPGKPAAEIIREAMKAKQIDQREMAERIGERADKLSIAIRCSSGSGPRSIEIRRKIAAFLALNPEEIWEEVYLTPRKVAPSQGVKLTVKRASDVSEDEWTQMDPAKRVRSLLRELNIDLATLAEALDVSYRVLTNNIYGATVNNVLRPKIAEFLGVSPSRIWDDLYVPEGARDKRPLGQALRDDKGLKAFHGFGDSAALGGLQRSR